MTVRSVVTAVVILFLVSEAVVALLRRARSSVTRHADEGSLAILWLTISISVGLASKVARWRRHGTPGPTDPGAGAVGVRAQRAGRVDASRWR